MEYKVTLVIRLFPVNSTYLSDLTGKTTGVKNHENPYCASEKHLSSLPFVLFLIKMLQMGILAFLIPILFSSWQMQLKPSHTFYCLDWTETLNKYDATRKLRLTYVHILNWNLRKLLKANGTSCTTTKMIFRSQ